MTPLPSNSKDRYQPSSVSGKAETYDSIKTSLKRLSGELDRFSEQGRRVAFWWRDDDAVSDTALLRRLLSLASELEAVVGLAVIPFHLEDNLLTGLIEAPCSIWQHGWQHLWKGNDMDKHFSKGEFGDDRDVAPMVNAALAGQAAMDHYFGPHGWQRVFVPPFHALSFEFKSILPSLGYIALSSGHPMSRRLPTLKEINAEVDVMYWPQRCCLGPTAIVEGIIQLIGERVRSNLLQATPIGILTHHLAMDDDAWLLTKSLLKLLTNHSGAEFCSPSEALRRVSSYQDPLFTHSRYCNYKADEVTVVATSCGRQDLLERTLDSFLYFNTYPVYEIIVIEDGDGSLNDALKTKYQHIPIRWLSTEQRVGQIKAIDLAYSEVSTEYIFHCEDDWEFYAPGFIEKSQVLLTENPSLLQVWLRSTKDTNRHPLHAFTLHAGGIPYQLLRHHHDAGEWGIWHGLSWNPGLRRTCDYNLLGSFEKLQSKDNKQTWEVECEASAFFQELGFYAAILTDRDGNGYVRHLGRGRRVCRDPSTWV